MQDIFQLVLAVTFNGDQLSTLNILGLMLCLGGIFSHVFHKYTLLVAATATDEQLEESVVSYDKKKNNLVHKTNGKFNRGSGQSIPLLDVDDSDSDDAKQDSQKASDVIFDVLTRRDTRR